jgi:predicted transcriptional regulator
LYQETEKARRNGFYLISEILTIAQRGAVKNVVMQRVGMSNVQLQKYITKLVEANLLDMTDNSDHVIYKTTEKGKDFLRKLEELTEILGSVR